MIADLGAQLSGIWLSVIFGLFLAVCYDILRLIRLSFGGGRRALFFCDLLFCFLSALASFLLALATNYGYLRFYHLGGEALGMLLWFFTLGRLFRLLFGKVIGALRALRRAICGAVRRLWGAFCRKCAGRAKKFVKKRKKTVKNS